MEDDLNIQEYEGEILYTDLPEIIEETDPMQGQIIPSESSEYIPCRSPSQKSYTFIFDENLYDLKPKKQKSPDQIAFKKMMKSLKGKKKDVNDYIDAYMASSLERASNRESSIMRMKYDPGINKATINLRQIEKRVSDVHNGQNMKELLIWNSCVDELKNKKHKLEQRLEENQKQSMF